MKTTLVLFTIAIAISGICSTERNLQLASISGNASYFNPYANPILPDCILGNTPVCGQQKPVSGVTPTPLLKETFANECIMILLNYEKVSEGWCIVQSTPAEPVDPENAETTENGFNQVGDPEVDPGCKECNFNYNPVCGINGVTYLNLCRLKKCANIEKAAAGPCGSYNYEPPSSPKPCPCLYAFSPACGDNGVTYATNCMLMCAEVSKKNDGACQRPCGCTTFPKPVCSTENETFDNECLLDCAGKEKKSDGKCPTSTPENCEHCKGWYDPVCGKNGVTYNNSCYLKCARVEQYCPGVCPTNKKCHCKDIWLPVCGIDSKTYKNECEAKCKGVNVKHFGPCKEAKIDNTLITGKCNCPDTQKLICGADQRTYLNPCYLKCLADGKGLHWGRCKALNPHNCHCPATGPEVCGGDGKIYLNVCVLKCMKQTQAPPNNCQVKGYTPQVQKPKQSHYHNFANVGTHHH